MATADLKPSPFRTVGEVQERLGGVPVGRILTSPAPGTAIANDLLDPLITRGRGVELVDGILVEKPMGFREDYIATLLIRFLGRYLDVNNVGGLCGSQGLVRFMTNLVRLPDVTFTRWDSAEDPADIEDPATAFLEVVPDLVVEVLSESNTPREMQIKLGGVRRRRGDVGVVRRSGGEDGDGLPEGPRAGTEGARPKPTRSTAARCCPASPWLVRPTCSPPVPRRR